MERFSLQTQLTEKLQKKINSNILFIFQYLVNHVTLIFATL